MRRSPLYIFVLICCLTGHLSFSQQLTKSEKRVLKTANKNFNKGEYLKAFYLYRTYLSSDTSNYEVIFKSGLCLFNINKTDSHSTVYFLKAKNKIHEAYFYLGRRNQLAGKTKEALEAYYHYKINGKNNLISLEELEIIIKKCENELLSAIESENYLVENLGAEINSTYPEYVPLLWNDTSLIYTSRRAGVTSKKVDAYGQYYEDIYISDKTNTGWLKPKLLSAKLSNETNDACVAFSSKENELIIYRTDAELTGGDLYSTLYKNGAWSDPVKLGPEVNSEHLEASACFSAGGNELIFSSNRPGGFGGKDLYKVVKFLNGKYSLPVNLGSEINTNEEEDAPFIDNADHSLYFSSRGHNSIGEYDIFKATYDETKRKWSDPINLGQPINSANDDIYFVKQEGKSIAYFASRRDGGFGDADIYEINFSESTKTIVYCQLKSGVSAPFELTDLQLSLYNVKTGKLEGSYQPVKNYSSLVLFVTKNSLYEIKIEGSNINSFSKQFVFNDETREIIVELTQKIN